MAIILDGVLSEKALRAAAGDDVYKRGEIWLDIMFDKTSLPFLIRAAEVSSQLDSIAKVNKLFLLTVTMTPTSST